MGHPPWGSSMGFTSGSPVDCRRNEPIPGGSAPVKQPTHTRPIGLRRAARRLEGPKVVAVCRQPAQARG